MQTALRRNDPIEARRVLGGVGSVKVKGFTVGSSEPNLHPGTGIRRVGGRLDQNGLQNGAADGRRELKTAAAAGAAVAVSVAAAGTGFMTVGP